MFIKQYNNNIDDESHKFYIKLTHENLLKCKIFTALSALVVHTKELCNNNKYIMKISYTVLWDI